MNEDQPQAPALTNSQATILSMTQELRDREALLDWVKCHADKLDSLPCQPNFYQKHLDFDNLNHAEVILVMQAFPCGKWTKDPMGERVTYTGIYDGIKVRCWAGEAPPSCKIIEERVLVPEHWEVVRRLQCPEVEQA